MGTYRTDRSYRWNYERGPAFPGPWPEVPATPEKRFCGLPVRSRLGISAGLLLNSRWIECYARLGFDLLAYKTVRTRYRPCYPLPNWVFLDAPGPVDAQADEPLFRTRRRSADSRRWTSAVCFGMPSMAPEVWREDVGRAREALAPGQALIVSVVGTPEEGGDLSALADDFAQAAVWAAAAGAQVVEANFSCPNVASAEGSLYRDADSSELVARRIRAAIPATPFLVKLGHFPSRESITDCLEALADHATGVVMVNAVSRRVLERDGRPVFGPERERVGVLGTGIRDACVENVRQAVEVSAERKLNLTVSAVGGVVSPDDADDYFAAGAQAVFMGGAPMLDPCLAIKMKAQRPDW